jgi:hypothetical protein
MVPLDFRVWNLGRWVRCELRGVPSPSLAEPDREDGLLILSSTDPERGWASDSDSAASGIDEIGSSLRSEGGDIVCGEMPEE